MKITETNSEQWDIKESGTGTIVVGVITVVGGVGLLGWVAAHLATIAWWWMLVAGGIVGIGVLMIFSASSRQITLRKQGASEIVTTKLVGGKQTKISFDSSQVTSVNLDTSDELKTETTNSGQTTTRERSSILYVLLRDNSQVMLATRRGGNGVSINGFDTSGLMKAPLADEARRIATFYGVPLSSRMNNAGGIETIATAISAVRQGIVNAQQPGVVANMQPQAQPQPVVATMPVAPVPVMPAVAQPVVPVPTLVQPIAPAAIPLQNGTVSAQPFTVEPVNVDDQPPR